MVIGRSETVGCCVTFLMTLLLWGRTFLMCCQPLVVPVLAVIIQIRRASEVLLNKAFPFILLVPAKVKDDPCLGFLT